MCGWQDLVKTYKEYVLSSLTPGEIRPNISLNEWREKWDSEPDNLVRSKITIQTAHATLNKYLELSQFYHSESDKFLEYQLLILKALHTIIVEEGEQSPSKKCQIQSLLNYLRTMGLKTEEPRHENVGDEGIKTDFPEQHSTNRNTAVLPAKGSAFQSLHIQDKSPKNSTEALELIDILQQHIRRMRRLVSTENSKQKSPNKSLGTYTAKPSEANVDTNRSVDTNDMKTLVKKTKVYNQSSTIRHETGRTDTSLRKTPKSSGPLDIFVKTRRCPSDTENQQALLLNEVRRMVVEACVLASESKDVPYLIREIRQLVGDELIPLPQFEEALLRLEGYKNENVVAVVPFDSTNNEGITEEFNEISPDTQDKGTPLQESKVSPHSERLETGDAYTSEEFYRTRTTHDSQKTAQEREEETLEMREKSAAGTEFEYEPLKGVLEDNTTTSAQEPAIINDPFNPLDAGTDLPNFLRQFMHSIISLINDLEGFSSPSLAEAKTLSFRRYERISYCMEVKRQADQEALRKKKQDDRDRMLAIRERNRRLARGPIEDLKVKDLKPLPAILYLESELGIARKYFSDVVTTWVLLHSAPTMFRMSRMSLNLFLQALQEDKETLLMEHTFRGLLEVIGYDGATPTSGMLTRSASSGKTWTMDVIDYLAQDIGIEKRSRPQKKRELLNESESSSDSESSSEGGGEEIIVCDNCDDVIPSSNVIAECCACQKTFHLKCVGLRRGPGRGWRCSECPAPSESSDSSEESSSADTEGSIERHEKKDEGESDYEGTDDEAEVTNMVKDARALGNYLTWANLSLPTRVSLLRALTRRALLSDKLNQFFAEASITLARENREVSREEDATKRFELQHKFWLMSERTDNGRSILRSLGSDRYKRLYWRFPMDRRLFVQTTTQSLPVPPEAQFVQKKSNVLFDEDMDTDRGLTKDMDATPKEWGTLSWAYFDALTDSLSQFGLRESGLKKNLDSLRTHVEKEYKNILDPEIDTIRITRSRTTGGGYINRLR